MELAVEGLLSMASPTITHSMERALVLEQGDRPILKRVTLAVFWLKLRRKFSEIKLTLTISLFSFWESIRKFTGRTPGRIPKDKNTRAATIDLRGIVVIILCALLDTISSSQIDCHLDEKECQIKPDILINRPNLPKLKSLLTFTMMSAPTLRSHTLD